MPQTVTTASTPAFVVDERSIDIDTGHQIRWADVPESFINSDTGKKEIRAGYAMKYNGSYAASAGDSQMIPIALDTDTELIGLLATDAIEDDPSAALSGYGVIKGGMVYENLLPNAAGGSLNATLKTNLKAIGTGFGFERYYDSRAA